MYQLLTDEAENEITLTAFRLLTLDLLTLYSVMNEGTINVLGKNKWMHVSLKPLLIAYRTLFRNVTAR
jgi:hypothetical protein